VLISTDLKFDQHATIVSGLCFYQLCQLRSVHQSLHTESITALIRAFVSSRVDYCSSVTDKLLRVLNAAARDITNTNWYESGLSQILHHDLHWLDVTERIQFRVAATVYQCLHGMPAYLTEHVYACHCVGKSSWRSSVRHNQQIGRTTLQTVNLRTRAFSVAGPVCWNALPDYLKSSDLSFDCSRHQLKH